MVLYFIQNGNLDNSLQGARNTFFYHGGTEVFGL